ncbi:MAG: cyclase [Glaciecola sp.]|jgi:cyclase
MIIFKIILLFALLIPPFLLAAQESKLFKTSQYSDSNFVLIGSDYGTNVGLIADDKRLLLIDPMPGEDSLGKLHSLIQGISTKSISYVANTHIHEDHTGGNAYFSINGATILDPTNLKLKSEASNEELLVFKRFGLEVFVVSSHTEQDFLYFHSKSNVLFVGDVFDNNWHPTFYAGGIDGFTKTINKILTIGNESTIIVPGHGAPAKKAVVKAFYNNTLIWLDRVSALHKAKLSVDQIMNDEQINEILQRFNTEKRKDFIPQRAFQRFIERTIEIVSINQ